MTSAPAHPADTEEPEGHGPAQTSDAPDSTSEAIAPVEDAVPDDEEAQPEPSEPADDMPPVDDEEGTDEASSNDETTEPSDADAATEAAEVSDDAGDTAEPDEGDEPASDEPAGEPDTQLHLRMLEALLFAASEPLDDETMRARLPKDADLPYLLTHLQTLYEPRGVNLVRIAGKWALRTAPDLAFMLRKETTEQKRLSRAGIETLAIVAYHQPVTRAEIEEIRGVGVSKGTLDLLIEIGWVRPRGRRRTPGRPVTYGTTEAFLQHFGMDRVGDLPGMEELKLAGLLDSSVPAGFAVPSPSDSLSPDEDPLDETDIAELLAPKAEED